MVPGSIPKLWATKKPHLLGPKKYRKREERKKKFQSGQSPPPLLQIVALSTAWAPLPSSLFAPGQQIAKPANLPKVLIKSLSPFQAHSLLIQWKAKTPSSHPLSTTYSTGICRLKFVSWFDWSCIFFHKCKC